MNLFEEKMYTLLNLATTKSNITTIMITLATALLLSAVLWGTYRFANTKNTYQPKFAITLVMLAFISTVFMDLIQSNLALSLGMLGSLSIVRFRTNIKDPRDIGFIFWSMCIGIAAGTNSYLIGAIGSIILAIFMLVTRKKSINTAVMMLVIRGSNTNINKIQHVVNQVPGNNTVKAKNILADSFELVYEMHLPERESNNMIGELFELGGIDSVNLLAANG
ncbi:DUF4956 domain-containing protein [Clostridium swellfunianum]|uniref:DUF4956 domain-containing protein n=1 Tax=Clostridium swellfunianum TaxID=1367462 RepID=UPI002030B6BA|nr:DUF4956 domain-containing protein [Clostridium swellfunianum]MCM0650518.1 DUF4956 domain-containing protein [Clostridium swellfunianum]